MTRTWSAIAVAIGCGLLVGCGGGGGGGGSDVLPGFVTADTRGGAYRGANDAMPPGGVALDAPAADAAEGAGDVAREIEEADVYAVDGDALVLLNVHRGLAVVDLAGPTLRGRLALSGFPRDLYVAGGAALAVLGSFDGGTDVVDVSLADPTAPAERARRSVPGFPVLSRRIGSVLYVVTSESVRTFSTDGLLTPLDAVTLPEGGYAAHASASFFAVAGAFDGTSTPVRLVDVSAPGGDLALRGVASVTGWVADDWKLDVSGAVLRVVAHDGTDGGLSRLTTWSIAAPDAPVRLATLPLARGEQLFATRFDGTRAYVVTFERVDPLWVIDLSVPAAPVVAGELTVPGWSTHLVPLGTRLVALGVESTPDWHLVASLFSVADPAAPALLDRADFGSGWSEAFADVRGFGVFAADGLVTVPVSGDGDRVAVIDLGATTLDVRGSVALSGTALRGFPHPRGLVCLSTEEVVVASLPSLAVAGRATVAENVVDVVRTSDGVVRPLVARSAGARLDGVDLPLWPERAFASGDAVCVVGWDDTGRAAYVVDFGGPSPVVSARLPLGDGWMANGLPSAGMAMPSVGGWVASEFAMTPGGRLVVHAAPSGADDGFAVIDVPGAAARTPVVVSGAFVTGFAVDGEVLTYTRAAEVAEDRFGRPRVRHALVQVDLGTRAETAPVNVPGWLLAVDGSTVFTAEESWDDGWAWTTSVVASALGAAEPTVLDRLALPDGAYDLRVAGRTLFFARMGAVAMPLPMPGDGPVMNADGAMLPGGMGGTGAGFADERGGVAPWFDAGLGTVRLGATLTLGPSIDATDAFRALLLPEDGAALVVRDGVHLERWDVSGPTAVLDFEQEVSGWPLGAHADVAPGTYLVALGYGGWSTAP